MSDLCASVDLWDRVLRARKDDDKPWLIVPLAPHRSSEHRVISYRSLNNDARRIAESLVRLVAVDDVRVAIIADNSAECCICIVGILLAGMTVVPMSAPGVGHPRQQWLCAFEQMVDDCGPAVVLGNAAAISGIPARPGMVVETFASRLAGEQIGHNPAGSRLHARAALWQYTSGTTGRARAAQLSHESILCNISEIGRRIHASEEDIVATWLPLFHDMGLIGSLLFATYWGMSLVILTPRTFVARPESWLWAIARFRVTCSAAPNSAYEICASKLVESKLRGLDLSSWRVAVNGSELIHPDTIERFEARFREYGFRAQAMYPVYGLAEHTVAAALPEYGRKPHVDWVDGALVDTDGFAMPASQNGSGVRGFVAVGKALEEHRIRIVGADEHVIVRERYIGEIQLSGPSKMLGYHDDAARDAFVSGDWLRTCDLGYLADGQLFVVGRTKHVIKRAGRAINAATVENALRTVAGIRGGVVAVFGVVRAAAGTEALVVMAEVEALSCEREAAVRSAITRAVHEAVSISPDVIELVRPGAVPRTTSGKVQHSLARQGFLRGLEQ